MELWIGFKLLSSAAGNDSLHGVGESGARNQGGSSAEKPFASNVLIVVHFQAEKLRNRRRPNCSRFHLCKGVFHEPIVVFSPTIQSD